MSRPQSRIRYGNRIISQKQDFQSMQKHYQSLKRTRPMTGVTMDRQTITINNRKKQMVQQNRFTQIQRQNRMLFHKISTIMNKGACSSTINSSQLANKKFNKTLNGVYRKKQLQNIQYQNAKMLKRLKQKTATYKVNDFHRDWQKKKAVIKKMALYPFILNDNIAGTINRQKIQNSFMIKRNLNNQLNMQQNMWQMRRVRNLNGFMFLITLKLQQNKFFIIGDMKQQQNIKIIELLRQQAQQFIRDQCNGRVQKMFDLLKFDKQSGDIYLVGNQFVQQDEQRMFQEQRRRVASQHGNRTNLKQYESNTPHNRNRNNSTQIPTRIISKQVSKNNKVNQNAQQHKLNLYQMQNYHHETINNQQQILNYIDLQKQRASKTGVKVKINQMVNLQLQKQSHSNDHFQLDRQKTQTITNDKNKVIQNKNPNNVKKPISQWVKIQNKENQLLHNSQLQVNQQTHNQIENRNNIKLQKQQQYKKNSVQKSYQQKILQDQTQKLQNQNQFENKSPELQQDQIVKNASESIIKKQQNE